jgi:resuscitation-promoting factor RpfA
VRDVPVLIFQLPPLSHLATRSHAVVVAAPATTATNSGASTIKKASDSTKKIAKKAAPKKYSASASGKTVRVKRGETLNKIAKRHHVKGGWKGLWKLNKKTIKNPNLIFIGQVIKIK